MSSITISSTSLNEEMNHLIKLCSYISQTASRIRSEHLSNVSFSPDYIKYYHHQLLSIAENIEGSAVLLESLLAIEKRRFISIETKKTRYYYTREDLLKLRQHVSSSLSIQIKHSLELVIERESNCIDKQSKTFGRDIRTILI
ncbi:unnamed protein product [Adineta steineri]|uniref:Uncharacterized protein n=1 Tax=Adineta steineri TaxID=433720 RepID=A0A815MVF2_9BILA|nr:unnamed protein product [Adineta steineri]